MADKLIDGTTHHHAQRSNSNNGPFWTSTTTGFLLYQDADYDLQIFKTTDSGDNWSLAAEIEGGSQTLENYHVWWDRQTADSGNLIHIVTMDHSGTDAIDYYQFDTSDDSLSTVVVVESGLTVDTTSYNNRVTICKAVDGDILIIGIANTSDEFAYLSTDGGASFNAVSTAFSENTNDHVLLMPAKGTGDDNDFCLIFGDRSAADWEVKMYDSSADTWTTTTISTTGNDIVSTRWSHNATYDYTNGDIYFVFWNDDDQPTGDCEAWKITPNSITSPTITQLTDVVSNNAESGYCDIAWDKQSGDLYVWICDGTVASGIFQGIQQITLFVSNDSGSTWDSGTVISEDTADDFRAPAGPKVVGDAGGFMMVMWMNHDLADIYVGLTNATTISAAAAAAAKSPYYYNNLLTGN